MASPLLDPERRDRLPAWVSGGERDRLGQAPADSDGLVVAGRLLRSDQVDPGLGPLLRAWVESAPVGVLSQAAAQAGARLDRVEREIGVPPGARLPGWAWDVVVARDDAESLLWGLGLARAAEEPSLVARAEALDGRWSRLESAFARDLWRSPGPDDRRWLLPLARSSEPAWWLDPLVVGRIREQALTWLTRPLAGAHLRGLTVPRPEGPLTAPPNPSPAEVDRWALEAHDAAARLAGGALAVHVRSGQASGVGLLVVHHGRVGGLTCRLDPSGAPPVEGDRATWLPVAPGETPEALILRWQGAEGLEEGRLPLRVG